MKQTAQSLFLCTCGVPAAVLEQTAFALHHDAQWIEGREITSSPRGKALEMVAAFSYDGVQIVLQSPDFARRIISTARDFVQFRRFLEFLEATLERFEGFFKAVFATLLFGMLDFLLDPVGEHIDLANEFGDVTRHPFNDGNLLRSRNTVSCQDGESLTGFLDPFGKP